MPDRPRLLSAACAAECRAAEDEWCILRTAHDDESIVRPFAFHRVRSEAFDDQLTVLSQKNYRAAQ